MSTANKLTYLNNTKQLLKQKINNLGGDITDNTTFRQYSEELQDIYDNLPKATGEGTEVSLNTVKGRMQITGKGNAHQDTRQYIDVGTWEQGGINGTTGQNEITTSMIRTKDYIEVKPNVLYEISRTVATNYMVFRFYDSGKNYLGNQGTAGMITTNRQTSDNRMTAGITTMQMTINNTNVTYMRMVDASNDLSTAYTIYTDNTPSPSYEQPIKVVTGENTVVVSGKNMLKPTITVEGTNIREVNCSVTVSKDEFTFVATGTDMRLGEVANQNISYTGMYGYLIEIPENATNVYLMITNNQFDKQFITFYDKDKISLGFYSITTSKAIPSGAKYCNFRIGKSDSVANTTYTTKVMVAFSSIDTYEPYISPISKQLDLGDLEFAKIGTLNDVLFHAVNGDKYYDSLSAEDKATLDVGDWYKHEKIGHKTLNGTESWSYVLSGTKSIHYTTITGKTTNKGGLKCNYYVYPGVSYIWQNIENNQIAEEINNAVVFIRNDSITSKEAFQTWLSTHNLELYYVLATPVFTKITNTTLISQLNAIENLMSNNGTTVISTECEEGNANLILSVSALKGA